MTQRFTDVELIDELGLSILGRADWLDRARKGQIKRPWWRLSAPLRGLYCWRRRQSGCGS